MTTPGCGREGCHVPRKRITSAAIAGIVVVAAIQLIPVRRTNPPVTADVSAPAEVETILRGACYDCHSNETRWPWYSRVAPVSWFIAHHIEEGRGDLNFSEWPVYDFKAQDEAFEDIRKQVSQGKMPLRSYRIMHPEARLTDAQRKVILKWAGEED
jgi:hypothetical protein